MWRCLTFITIAHEQCIRVGGVCVPSAQCISEEVQINLTVFSIKLWLNLEGRLYSGCFFSLVRSVGCVAVVWCCFLNTAMVSHRLAAKWLPLMCLYRTVLHICCRCFIFLEGMQGFPVLTGEWSHVLLVCAVCCYCYWSNLGCCTDNDSLKIKKRGKLHKGASCKYPV